MKYISSVILSLFLYGNLLGQKNSTLDSLLERLPSTAKDTNLVLLYYDIGYQFALNDYDNAIAYYKKAQDLSYELGYTKGLILYTAYYGNILKIQGNYDSALRIDKEALKLAIDFKDSVQIAKSYINIGNVFHHRKQYDSTIFNYEMAKKYAGLNTRLSAHIAYLMVPAYLDWGRKEEAIAQGEASLAYFKQADEPSMLGQVMLNLGSAYEASGNTPKARLLLNEALQISRDIGFDELRLHCLVSLMNDYLWHNKGADTKIATFAEEALHIALQQENMMGVVLIYRGLGNHYKFKRSYKTALKYIDTSLNLATKHQMLHEVKEGLLSKGLLLTAMGNLEEGNDLLNQSAALEDSIVNNETREQVLALEKSFEIDKKEAQIKLQEATIRQKNLLNYLLIGSTISLALILLLLYRNYRHRQKIQKSKIEELENEKQLLAAQSLLKGQEEERSRLAKDLHDGLGGMLSGVKLQLGAMKGNMIMTEENGLLFTNALNKLDQSISEMRRVAHNMMPEALIQLGLEQALRDYCNNISITGAFSITTEFYGLEKRMSSTTEVTIYRIVQELVNNAVKHANAQNILVQVLRRGQLLTITVEDDGKGFDSNGWQDRSSAGLLSIQSRVHYLNGTIDIKSSQNAGTSVYIECTTAHNE